MNYESKDILSREHPGKMDAVPRMDPIKWEPIHLVEPDGWVGHIPFAFWLTTKMQPQVFVELGTHTGNSYFAFCQAVNFLNLGTKCYAIDSWKGDAHAGFYGEDVYDLVTRCNSRYSKFSTLLRATFDTSVDNFADKSIDLLHIDGFHSYDAVKHDFETWFPKMSEKSIILLHDTNADDNRFGVNTFYSELSSRFPHFEFPHSNGLGVIKIGKKLGSELDKLFASGNTKFARSLLKECASSGDILLRRLTYERRLKLGKKDSSFSRLLHYLTWHRRKFTRFLKKKIRSIIK